MTGLPDKDFFFGCCRDAVLDENSLTAIHLLYIGNLKDVIMEHGLHVGEGVLKNVSNRLYGVLSSNRTFARLEGETFGVLQQDVEHVGHVLYVSRRIFETLKDPVDIMGHQINVEMNIGVAFYPDHGKTWEDVHHNAALALEKARQEGIEQFVVYEE